MGESSLKRVICCAGLVLGCAGTDGSLDAGQEFGATLAGEEESRDAELGTLQQALLMVPGIPGLPDGYGVDKSVNRCWTDGGQFDWGGGFCRVPSHKTGWTVYVPSTNSTKGCTNSAVRTAINDAALLWGARMQAEGWGVTISTAAEVAGDRKFAIKCDTSTSTFDLAVTRAPGSCDHPDTNFCAETPYGILLTYNDIVDIRLYTANIGTDYEYIRNITTHELGHAFGLGHDTPAETCLMMPAVNGAGCPSPFTSLRAPTTFELDMLLEYDPI